MKATGYKLWQDYSLVVENNKELGEQVFSSVYVSGCGELIDSLVREIRLVQEQLSIPVSLHRGTSKSVRPSCLFALQKDSEAWVDAFVPYAEQAAVLEGLNQADTGEEGFVILTLEAPSLVLVVANTERGLLYGGFHLIRSVSTGADFHSLNTEQKPDLKYRMLNHWDDMDGHVEQGFAGNSLWKWDELPGTLHPRYTDYARANASIGLNCSVLNNVNNAQGFLESDFLPKIQALADVFRPYGIQVFLSVSFASPILVGGLETADPLDDGVKQWWKEKVAEIYGLIPDFGGFLVKADSEGQPGPYAYERSHSEGANMLAMALEPHGGLLIWRTFVYGHGEEDRVVTAYKTFVEQQDGAFSDNVVLQAKSGPLDFQPIEPVNPLFGGFRETGLFLELMITQQYLGEHFYPVYQAPMWKEILKFDTFKDGEGSDVASLLKVPVTSNGPTGIAGVTNIGDDGNWCGSVLHQANWYAFGRLTWDTGLSSEAIADEWVRATFGTDAEVVRTISSILLSSLDACRDYMSPFGLHHIFRKEEGHYGPGPGFDKYTRGDWNSTYYHRADADGLGFDRTRSGTGYVDQYHPENANRFNSLEACDEDLLVWFHHVPWTHRLANGRTLAEELPLRFARGVHKVERICEQWQTLQGKIDDERFQEMGAKFANQLEHANKWRSVCTEYFTAFFPPESANS